MLPEIWSAPGIIFCHFGSFLPVYLTIDPKNCNSAKHEKKKPGDNILLSMCTINEDYMIYSSKF